MLNATVAPCSANKKSRCGQTPEEVFGRIGLLIDKPLGMAEVLFV
ncbi:MAG TPA: hypothetical protein VNX28_15090 [Gemmataceae bacterium]|nr:hypothetical protein [Gemmataceae bacterium]